jgi:hypothetical protein
MGKLLTSPQTLILFIIIIIIPNWPFLFPVELLPRPVSYKKHLEPR